MDFLCGINIEELLNEEIPSNSSDEDEALLQSVFGASDFIELNQDSAFRVNGFQTLCYKPSSLPFSPNEDQRAKITASTTKKIDGFTVLGTSWNILKPSFLVSVLHWPTIKQLTKLSFKGIPEVCDPKFKWSMKLASLDNAELNLVITADTNRPCNASTDTRADIIAYNRVSQAVNCILVHVIVTMEKEDCATKFNYFESGMEKKIVIHPEDWEEIGNALELRLQNLTAEDLRVFPAGCKFWFLVSQYGQDTLLEKFTSTEHFPHIQLHNSTRKVVHVAMDQNLPDNILWFTKGWISNRVRNINNRPLAPSYAYNVGLLKDTGNFTYTNIPENSEGIQGLFLYTKIFSAVHRKTDNLLETPLVVKLLLTAYLQAVHGKAPWKNSGNLGLLLNGKFKDLKNGIIATLEQRNTWNARVEFLWSSTSEEFASMRDLFHAAGTQTYKYASDKHFLDGAMYICTPRKEYTDKFKSIIAILCNTVDNVCDKMRICLDNRDFYQNDILQAPPTLKEFASAHLSEALLKRILRGSFQNFENHRNSRTLKFARFILTSDERPGFLLEWPFDNRIAYQEDGKLSTTVSLFDLAPGIWDGIFKSLKNLSACPANLQKLHECYSEWVKGRASDQGHYIMKKNTAFFRELVNAILRCTFSVARLTIMEAPRLTILWNLGANDRLCGGELIVYCIEPTQSLFKVMVSQGVSRYAGFAGLKLILEMIKKKGEKRLGGGTQISLAKRLDECIMDEKVPFVLEIPRSKERKIFVPFHFTEPTPNLVNVYLLAFERTFGRTNGLRDINVRKFLIPLLVYMGRLDFQKRPVQLHKIMSVVNKLLDVVPEEASQDFYRLDRHLRRTLASVRESRNEEQITDSEEQDSIHPTDSSLVNIRRPTRAIVESSSDSTSLHIGRESQPNDDDPIPVCESNSLRSSEVFSLDSVPSEVHELVADIASGRYNSEHHDQEECLTPTDHVFHNELHPIDSPTQLDHQVPISVAPCKSDSSYSDVTEISNRACPVIDLIREQKIYEVKVENNRHQISTAVHAPQSSSTETDKSSRTNRRVYTTIVSLKSYNTSNESSESRHRKSASKNSKPPVVRRSLGILYTKTEDRKLFLFLYKANLLEYMMGTTIAKFLANFNICGSTFRSHQSINSRIKTCVRRRAYLKAILPYEVYKAVLKAKKKIKELFKRRSPNMVSEAELQMAKKFIS